MNMKFEITTLGERGQIVIPLELRERLNLGKGEKFMIVESGEVIILKRLTAPSEKEFNELLKKAKEHAKKETLTEKDLIDAIEKTRRKKE